MSLSESQKSVAFGITHLAGLQPCLDANAQSRCVVISHRTAYDRVMQAIAEMDSNVTGLWPFRLVTRSSKPDDMMGHIGQAQCSSENLVGSTSIEG